MTILPYFLADVALCVPNIVFFGLAAGCPTHQIAARYALEALGVGYFIHLGHAMVVVGSCSGELQRGGGVATRPNSKII